MVIEHLLADFNTIVNINPSMEAVLRESFTLRQFKKGKIIARLGEKVPEMWYLHKGLAKEYFIVHPSGKKAITRIWKENEVILLIQSFLLEKDSNFYVQLIEDCTLLSLGREGFQNLVTNFPEFNAIVYEIFSESFRRDDEHCGFLGLNATEKYRRFCSLFPQNRISLTDTASYVGLSKSGLANVRAQKQINRAC